MIKPGDRNIRMLIQVVVRLSNGKKWKYFSRMAAFQTGERCGNDFLKLF